NSTTNTFTTNADGQRVTASDSAGHRRFIYDGTNLLAEQDIASGNLIAAYDYGVGGLVRQVRGAGARYYQFDGLGSTRQLTDASQAVTDAVSYEAWGNVLSSSGATVNPYEFVGQLGYYANGDSGLMLLGVRYYGSGVGRFWTADPTKDGHNWYAYVHNNPANLLDPTGKAAQGGGAVILAILRQCVLGALVGILADVVVRCFKRYPLPKWEDVVWAACMGCCIALTGPAGLIGKIKCMFWCGMLFDLLKPTPAY
ncbi:MAG: hypothetical protein NZT92_23065, partial [Abditibacteriales bacterium]|nr:hypothetical protein [Abditibacteriales bacterium]